MRRLGFAAVLIVGLLLAGCGDSPESQADYNTIVQELAQARAEVAALKAGLADQQGLAPTSVDAAEDAEALSLLFVQEARGGTLTGNADGTYTLTLSSVIPHTIYFSDRPFVVAGFIPTDVIPYLFDWESPPNAAVVPQEVDASGDVLIVQLLSSDFNSESQAISYSVRVVDWVGEAVGTFIAEGADVARSHMLGATSVFIDDLSYDEMMTELVIGRLLTEMAAEEEATAREQREAELQAELARMQQSIENQRHAALLDAAPQGDDGSGTE